MELPIEIVRKKRGLKPTRYGLLFILLLIGMLIGSVNYNNNLGFLLTFLLGSMGLMSIMHTLYNLNDICILTVENHSAYVGQQVEFVLKIKTGNPPKYGINLGSQNKGGSVAVSIESDKETTVRFEIPAQERGILRAGALILSSIYPLGLFAAWSKFDVNLESIVYPAPNEKEFEPRIVLMAGGEKDGLKGAGTEDFDGLGTYQPGDSLKRVSWKAFSKGQGLFVKEFIGYQSAAVMIDWDDGDGDDTEKRLSVLCGMVLKAHAAQLEYGLKIPGTILSPEYSDQHKHRCLKALALYNP